MRSDSDASAYACTLHHSVTEVPPADWKMIVDEDRDLAMDRRLIAAQERTLVDQCRMWTAVVRDAQGRPAACACLCLYKVDAVVSAHPMIRRMIAIGRRAVPGLLRIGVLFCGLPVPAGENHLRLAPSADPRGVIACLHAAMHTLARRHRATLLVFKEFDACHSQGEQHLEGLGYIAGDVPPMHRLASRFHDFDAFLASMRSRYRAQVLRSMRKIVSGRFVIERHIGPEAIDRAFTSDLHTLYERVWERSRYQLEHLPHGFFRAASEAAPGDAALTVIHREGSGAAVGFTFSIARGATWHNLYSGVDYSINGEGDILFNLFYADLGLALERGCRDIRLGQTSDAFKSRLGASPQELRFFVRARSSITHAGLRALAGALFPSLAPPAGVRVFKEALTPTSGRGIEHAAASGMPVAGPALEPALAAHVAG